MESFKASETWCNLHIGLFDIDPEIITAMKCYLYRVLMIHIVSVCTVSVLYIQDAPINHSLL